MWKYYRIGLIIAALSTSACVSTLSCGVDGEASWVQLEQVRDTTTVREYGKLCGFAYQQENQ